MKKIVFLICAIALFSSYCTHKYKSQYKIANAITIGGNCNWDYLTIDTVNGHIITSHGNITQAIDIKTNKLVGTITNTPDVHGIDVNYELNCGYTGNGADSSVTVFKLKTYDVITRIKLTGANADAVLYDAFSKRVFVFNFNSNNVSVIDTKSNKEIALLPLNGSPEFSATDGKGKVFVNLQSKSSLAVINTKTLKVDQQWSIAPGKWPSGLAIDTLNHRLFSVCGNDIMVVFDYDNGKVIITLPIGSSCDGVAFDTKLKRACSANGDGTMTVVQQENANSYKIIETVKTLVGARTLIIDNASHHLYLPTVDYEPASSINNNKIAAKPNTFKIIDIEVL